MDTDQVDETVEDASSPSTLKTDDNPSVEVETPTSEAVPPGQAQPQPDDPLTILDGLTLDPKLKETLKAGYLRNADYTRKTMELAKVRNVVDEYQKVRPLLEYLDKNPEVFNDVYSKMQGAQPEGQERIPEDPKEYAEWVKSNTIKEVLEIQARDQDFQQAATVDPRLNAEPEFGEMIARMVAQDPEYRNKVISAVEATKKAVASFDRYVNTAITRAKAELSEKAKVKREGSATRTLPGKVADGRKPVSIIEAAEMAEEELS